MQSTIEYLAGACAGALLLACAGNPAQRGAGGAPAAVADTARPGQGQAGADGYYALARSQQAAHRPAEALLSYRRALVLDPGHRGARNGLAVLHAARGEWPAAIALWQGLTAGRSDAQTEDAFLFANLGYAYLLSGQAAPAITALEKACLLAPLHAPHWRRLAEALEHDGQGVRAAQMQRQAQALQAHEVRADDALARQAEAGLAPADGAAAMARSEVLVGSGGLLELRRVAAPARGAAQTLPSPRLPPAPLAAPMQAARPPAPMTLPHTQAAPGSIPAMPAAPPAAALPETPASAAAAAPLRLEIRNGNGVAGMAGALARLVGGDGVQVVKVANAGDFRVPLTRVEYAPQQEAAARAFAARLGPLAISEQADCKTVELRVILGHDLSDPAALRRYYLRQLKLARAALARLG